MTVQKPAVCDNCVSGRCHWEPDGASGRRALGAPCDCPDHDAAVRARLEQRDRRNPN